MLDRLGAEFQRSAGLFVALLAAVAWAVLAARTPTNTYHFAPMVVAALWVAYDGYRGAGLTQRKAVNLAVVGFVLAAGTAVVLNVKGDLDGPVFWQESGDAPVLFEHLLFAAIGAVAGLLLAIRQAARPPSAR